MVSTATITGLHDRGSRLGLAGWAVVGASGVPAGILLPVVFPRSGESHSGLSRSAGLSRRWQSHRSRVRCRWSPFTRISIFLSVFDVHVNRSPVAGIREVRYQKGKYLNAMNPASAEHNEQNVVTVEGDGHTVVFKQIAGLLARRIVFNKKVGDTIMRGERVGLMKFGLLVNILLKDPSSASNWRPSEGWIERSTSSYPAASPRLCPSLELKLLATEPCEVPRIWKFRPRIEDHPPCGMRKGMYILPSLFTTANIAFGYVAIAQMHGRDQRPISRILTARQKSSDWPFCSMVSMAASHVGPAPAAISAVNWIRWPMSSPSASLRRCWHGPGDFASSRPTWASLHKLLQFGAIASFLFLMAGASRRAASTSPAIHSLRIPDALGSNVCRHGDSGRRRRYRWRGGFLRW